MRRAKQVGFGLCVAGALALCGAGLALRFDWLTNSPAYRAMQHKWPDLPVARAMSDAGWYMDARSAFHLGVLAAAAAFILPGLVLMCWRGPARTA